MAIAIVDITSDHHPSNGGSDPMTLTYPATVNAGDLLFCASGGDNSSQTYTWPSPWTKVSEMVNSQSGFSTAFLVADGTEGGNTFDLDLNVADENAWVFFRITGAVDPAVTAIEHSASNNATDTAPNPLAVTLAGGSKEYLFIAISLSDSNDNISSGPSGYINLGQDKRPASGTGTIAWATKIATTAGPEDPSAFTLDTLEQWTCAVFAISPDAGGGSIVPLITQQYYQRNN